MAFVIHPTRGRGWMTEIEVKKRRVVLLQTGPRIILSPKLLYRDPTPPAYPPITFEYMTLTMPNGKKVVFDVHLAWRLLHPTRQTCVFQSLDEMRTLVSIGDIKRDKLAKSKFTIPAIVGQYYGNRYIIDGHHRITKALNTGVTMQYYLLSPAETNYLTGVHYVMPEEGCDD